MAYNDLFSQYFNNRDENSDTQANVTPQSTTINYNEDGSHDITHKMNVAPVAPTVESQPQRVEPMPVAQAPAQPVPVAPQAPAQPMPVAQAPAPVSPQEVAAPVAPAQPIAQAPAPAPAPVAPVSPMIAGNASSDVGLTPTEQAVKQMPPVIDHSQNLIDWSGDPRKVSLIANDRRTPEEGGPPVGAKIMANKELAEHYIGEKKKNEEYKKADNMVANGDTVGISNVLKSNARKEDEGSYLKAYLFRRLGMSGLAEQEETKLGAGSTMQQVPMPDGSTALVRIRKDGAVSYGHDIETGKELDAKQLEGIAGYATNLKSAQTQATHAYTTEKSRLEKMRDERIAEGYSQADLTKEGLDDASIEAKSQKSGADVMSAAQSRYRGAPARAPMPGAPGMSQQIQTKGEATAPTITPNNKIAAADWASDAGLPVISGHRNTEKQASLIDHYDANGIARTAEGRPVAVPGTSKHETYDAFDVDPKKMTPQMEADARAAGFKNDIKDDPNHWYRETTPRGEITTAKPEKKGILENWEQKRSDENFTAYKNRRKLTAQEIDDAAQALADGSMAPKDLSARAGSNLREYAMLRAKEINPNFNGANADVMKKTKMDFTSGKTSNQVLAHTTALGQVAMVEEAFAAQKNGDTQLLNQIKRRYEVETGNSLPIAANTSVAIFGPEVIKSIVPGGGALHDRLEAKGLLNPNMSPEQFKAAMGIIKNFQGESLLSLRNKWTSSGLPKEGFRNQILADSPDAQDALDAAEHHRTGRREEAANPAPAVVDHKTGAQAELDRRRKARGY